MFPNPLLLRTGRQRRAIAAVIVARPRTTRFGQLGDRSWHLGASPTCPKKKPTPCRRDALCATRFALCVDGCPRRHACGVDRGGRAASAFHIHDSPHDVPAAAAVLSISPRIAQATLRHRASMRELLFHPPSGGSCETSEYLFDSALHAIGRAPTSGDFGDIAATFRRIQPYHSVAASLN